jgi:hypothetical protein
VCGPHREHRLTFWPGSESVSSAIRAWRHAALTLFACLALGGCDFANPGPTQQFVVAGSVSGLASGQSVVLAKGQDRLTVSVNGIFALPTPIAANGSYDVSIVTQPTSQVCAISNATGTRVQSNITNVNVVCSNDSYTISGALAGLPNGERVVLADNVTDSLTLTADGSFGFSKPVPYNGSYSITVVTQPSSATCTVSRGSSAGVTANVSNVSVGCSANSYTVSGILSGLSSGTQVVLDDNGGDALTVSANGSFSFSTPIAGTNGSDGSIVISVQ